MSRHSQTAEIQLSYEDGTNETAELSSGMEIIYGTQTISETETTCETRTLCETQTIRGMETTICVVTGKDTFSLTAQGIGIAIGTQIAIIGGMVTDAPSLTVRG